MTKTTYFLVLVIGFVCGIAYYKYATKPKDELRLRFDAHGNAWAIRNSGVTHVSPDFKDTNYHYVWLQNGQTMMVHTTNLHQFIPRR